MNIKPIGKRILAKVIEKEQKKGSLILTNDKSDKTKNMKVIAVGSVADIFVDDIIMCLSYVGTAIEQDEEKFLIVNEEDILAVVK